MIQLLIILGLLYWYCLFNHQIEHYSDEIPKTIHQIWVGSDVSTLPDYKKTYMNSYRDVLSNKWKYRVWTNKDITPDNFPLTYPYLQKLVNRKKWSSVADLMKFEIIYQHGGFYFDTNIELMKSLDHLVEHDFIICNEDENMNKYISCGFLAGKPKSPYLERLLSKKSLDKINLNFNKGANYHTGPYFFRKAFTDNDLHQVHILPTHQIYPISPKGKNKCLTDLCLSNKEPIYPCKRYPFSLAVDHFCFGHKWK